MLCSSVISSSITIHSNIFNMAELFKTTLIVLFLCFGFCYQLNGNDECTEMEAFEGDNVTLRCNATKTVDIIQFVWGMPNNNSRIGQNITIDDLTQADIGVYTCYVQKSSSSPLVNAICLNVYGPPDTPSDFKVTKVTKSNATLNWITGYDYNRAQTFIVYQHSASNSTVFHEQIDTSDGHGNTHVEYVINELTANLIYNLTIESKNSYGSSPPSDVLVFSPYGKPTIDPKEDVKLIIRSRLYDPVTLEMHAIGYPPPFYTWLHDNQKLYSSDQTYSSEVTIKSMTVRDYGNYILIMTNEAGTSIYTFFIAAYGPPERPTSFTVVDIGATNATLFWVTGYDYNETQTFVIGRTVDGEIKEFKAYPDESGGHSNTNITQTVDGFTEGTEYSLTIFSRNKNGNSPVSNNLQFMTFERPKMDPNNHTTLKFTPRTKETISLVMYAVGNPPPIFLWEHKGVALNSSDDNSTSTVTLDNVMVEDFGNYTLTMSNKVGSSVYTYVLEADGPPDPVSTISINDIRNTSLTLSWLTGFDYESNQTFIVYSYSGEDIKTLVEVPDNSSDPGGKRMQLMLHNLSPRTFYNISVWSINARGATNAMVFSSFTTFGEPIPDPSKPVNETTSPRLGETSSFTMKWLANPDPTIIWTHNTKTINHNETGMTTSIELADINVTSYGDYILTMNNSYGVYTHTFRIKADGPPDPVSDIEVFNITETSALLEFKPGFNYNNTQWFKIHIETSNREIDMIIKDTTDGIGDSKQDYALIQLNAGTDYELNILAISTKGFANKSPTVHFRTEESTKTGSIPINILITIIVCVSTGLVIISMVSVLIYRKRKRSNARVAYLNYGEVGGRTNSKVPNNESMHESTSLKSDFVHNEYASFSNGSDSTSSVTLDKDTMEIILKGIDLGHLVEKFRTQAVGPNEVLDLSNDDMKSLGVTTIGHKIRLLKACRNYLKVQT